MIISTSPSAPTLDLIAELAAARPGTAYDLLAGAGVEGASDPWIRAPRITGIYPTELGGVSVLTHPDDMRSVEVTTTDGSRRLALIFGSEATPRRVDFDLDLPPGARWDHDFAADAVYLRSSAGDFLGGVATPWAVDANFREVNTYFLVTERGLSQVIEPRADTVFPVIADPAFGRRLVASARWVTRSSRGRTLEVAPTMWNRITMSQPWAIRAGWEEVLERVPEAGTEQLFRQYRCHQQFAPIKRRWNLDEWIIRENYLDSIYHLCN